MTEKQGIGTSGGRNGTGGISPRALLWLLLTAVLAYGLVQIVANIYSKLADGDDVTALVVWIDEGSSLTIWMLLLLAIWWAGKTFRPPGLSWPLALLAHAAMTVPVSLAHVGGMVALREFAWLLAGESYHFTNNWPGAMLYEYRKDVATYFQLAMVLVLIQWLVVRYAAGRETVEPAILAVPDGAITHLVPIDEIDQVQAAGNYVELGWRGRRLLHRATLASLEEALSEHGFVRIHRSRLVRRGAVRRVAINQSGDFEIELENGETLKGSRRYRAALS